MSSPRSVTLDKHKVRTKAYSLGITKRHSFEQLYANHFNKLGEHRAPKYAWEQKPFSKKGAAEIAEILGVGSYTELLLSEMPSPWNELVQNNTQTSDFSELKILEPNESYMFSMRDQVSTKSNADVVSIDIKSRFYLSLEGIVGNEFMAVMLSEHECLQLAPLGFDGFSNIFNTNKVRYPSNSLLFDQAKGLGWRQCIIIKSDYIPLAPRNDNLPLTITADELNTFARLLKAEERPVFVDCHEFCLVDKKANY